MSSERTFKTGDPHPQHSLLRFVEYDERDGEPIWCSICRDAEAPFRLAEANKRDRDNRNRELVRTHHTGHA
jgi:hypothetical protein